MRPIRQSRKKTAREIAARFGVSERTVRAHVAEDRDTYESRAAKRRKVAGTMADKGATWAAIAEAVGGSEWAARGLVRRYRAEQEPAAANAAAPACGRERVGEGRGLRPQKP